MLRRVIASFHRREQFSETQLRKCYFDEGLGSFGSEASMAELLRNKDTVQAESALAGAVVRQLALKIMLEPYETNFDAVIIDVSPSSNLFQTCAGVQ
jgi:hypothetical protein